MRSEIRGLAGIGLAFVLVAIPSNTVHGQPLECPAIDGIDSLVRPGTVFLVGEIHGSREAPAFASGVACRALEAGRDVVLALEIPAEERGRVRAFLDSPGEAEDRRAVLTGPFWRRPHQDGRSSRAMLEVLDRARALRRETGRLEVRVFDRAEVVDSQTRDRRLSRDLEAIVASVPDAVTVVLTGNIHARVEVGTPWDADFEPMGYLLRRALPGRRIVALDLAHPAGSAWVCTGPEPTDCGERRMNARGSPAPTEHPVVRLADDPKGPFHGTYTLPSLSASPPAHPAADQDPP